jgi:hypothetical protein
MDALCIDQMDCWGHVCRHWSDGELGEVAALSPYLLAKKPLLKRLFALLHQHFLTLARILFRLPCRICRQSHGQPLGEFFRGFQGYAA